MASGCGRRSLCLYAGDGSSAEHAGPGSIAVIDDTSLTGRHPVFRRKQLHRNTIPRKPQEGRARLNALREDDLDARFPGLLRTILSAADELQPLGVSEEA